MHVFPKPPNTHRRLEQKANRPSKQSKQQGHTRPIKDSYRVPQTKGFFFYFRNFFEERLESRRLNFRSSKQQWGRHAYLLRARIFLRLRLRRRIRFLRHLARILAANEKNKKRF